MWIGMNTGWLSIVKNRNDERTLLVRARDLDHILAAFPDCDHFKDDTADYPYRAYITREEVSQRIAEGLMEIEYDNFKASVRDKHLLTAYDMVWGDIAMTYWEMR